MLKIFISATALALLSVTFSAVAAGPAVGAAPAGDATAVASKVIKWNFPSCRKVTSAERQRDGSIRARCDGTNYLVFTMFNPKEGKAVELALNCKAAKQYLDIDC